jgi:hypothetical protein
MAQDMFWKYLENPWCSWKHPGAFVNTLVLLRAFMRPSWELSTSKTYHHGTKYLLKKIVGRTITRNLVLCIHPICNYTWLSVICNYVL